MFHRLWIKLTAGIMLVVIVGVTIVAVLSNRVTTTEFQQFVSQSQLDDLQLRLISYYRQQGNWTGVEALLAAERNQRGLAYRLLDPAGALIVTAGAGRGRPLSSMTQIATLPIAVDGLLIGTLLVLEPGGAGQGMMTQSNLHADAFLQSVNQALLWGGLAAVALALLLGVWLSQRLTRPLQQLTQATHRLAAGDLSQSVDIHSSDEIGDLAASFNQMAQSLSTAEQQRQQMLADVAHELRTPLSVMRGHLEGMLDGIFAPTPENLTLVHEETVRLGRLVDELRTLSLAEAGQLPLEKTSLDMALLLQQAFAAFTPLAEAEGVQLSLDLPAETLPPVLADKARMQQVLGNLLANALRYAPQGSSNSPQVTLGASASSHGVRVFVRDNGPGLTAEAQARVFDRFWRADAARSRAAKGSANGAGSGLGLSICRGIIHAHGGRIGVESQPGLGTTFWFELF
ncbi:MAG: ATP-binding protein [Candidatus Promineifilaceae bacterium]